MGKPSYLDCDSEPAVVSIYLASMDPAETISLLHIPIALHMTITSPE